MIQTDKNNKEMEDIVNVINEIATKTKVINDIVFQTKLLSFNASVEAARAGENGKGFAVVAEEVGSLASMSGAAAIEITSMLDGSIQKVESIAKNSKENIGRIINDGRKNIEMGTKVANDCGEVLTEIVLSVASVSKIASEIVSASEEQAQGVSEMSKAIAQLDQVTQLNTTNSAGSSHAAAALSTQAEILNLLVTKLVQVVEGEAQADQKAKMNGSKRETSAEQRSSSGFVTGNTMAQASSEAPSANDRRFRDI